MPPCRGIISHPRAERRRNHPKSVLFKSPLLVILFSADNALSFHRSGLLVILRILGLGLDLDLLVPGLLGVDLDLLVPGLLGLAWAWAWAGLGLGLGLGLGPGLAWAWAWVWAWAWPGLGRACLGLG